MYYSCAFQGDLIHISRAIASMLVSLYAPGDFLFHIFSTKTKTDLTCNNSILRKGSVGEAYLHQALHSLIRAWRTILNFIHAIACFPSLQADDENHEQRAKRNSCALLRGISL